MLLKGEVQFREYVWDYDVDGGATGDLQMRPADGLPEALPEGCLVKDAVVVTEEALTTSGSPTLTFGTLTDSDGFLADAMAALTNVNSVVRAGEKDGALLWDSTADAKKAYRVPSTANSQKPALNIGTAALTGGKLRMILELYNPGSGVGDLS